MGGSLRQADYRSKNAGWSAILTAEKFLRAREQRTIGDDNGVPSSPGRTFYLLDVLPEVRLKLAVLVTPPELSELAHNVGY